jgi:serine/threonine-protein kinase RsbW
VTASPEVRAELERRPLTAPDGLLAAFTLPAVPESAGAARRRVRAALISRGLAGVAEDTQTIASELVANAVQHAGSPVDVALIIAGSVLVIVAADSSPVPPVIKKTSDGESGRGLIIVDAVADRWGSWPSRAGKAVWAAVRIA